MRKPSKPNILDRLRAKKAMRETPTFGVCWYAEEEWAKIKSEAVDPDGFEKTYAEWERMAAEVLQDLNNAGLQPMKVLVVSDELRQWCKIHGKQNNASSRSAFVAELLGKNRAIIACNRSERDAPRHFH